MGGRSSGGVDTRCGVEPSGGTWRTRAGRIGGYVGIYL